MKRNGVSLIEVLISITILGVIINASTFTLINYRRIYQRSKYKAAAILQLSNKLEEITSLPNDSIKALNGSQFDQGKGSIDIELWLGNIYKIKLIYQSQINLKSSKLEVLKEL